MYNKFQIDVSMKIVFRYRIFKDFVFNATFSFFCMNSDNQTRQQYLVCANISHMKGKNFKKKYDYVRMYLKC